jgi:hypothetical protein
MPGATVEWQLLIGIAKLSEAYFHLDCFVKFRFLQFNYQKRNSRQQACPECIAGTRILP